jgi:hypothetical protein
MIPIVAVTAVTALILLLPVFQE